MSEETKEVTVEIDTRLYSAVEEYCNYTGASEESFVNYLLSHALNEFSSDYNNLKQGYVENGNINLEISDAFSVSENEAFSRFEEWS